MEYEGQFPERKYLDTFVGAASYNFGPAIGSTGTPVFTLLNGLSQGTSASNRIGRQVTICSVQLKTAVQLSATTTPGLVRTIVFWDQQANAAAPTIVDLLENSGAALAMLSPLNMSNRDRFVVLWDAIDEISLGKQSVALLNLYAPVDVQTTYNAVTGGAVNAISTNSLYACTFTDAGVADPVATGYYRVRYFDS